MRFLIVAAAVFACAAAAPSGALLGSAAWGVASPWAVAASPVGVIPAGDVQGAAIDAAVAVNNNARAAVDAVRQVSDQAAELQGRAINAAEGQAWQAVNAAQTVQAQVDGAVASVAPNVARSLVGPVAAPLLAAPAIASPLLAAPALAAPAVLAARAIAAPAIIPGSQSISTQSLSQTHPSPLIAAPLGLSAISAHGW